jgi:hypothetical protein
MNAIPPDTAASAQRDHPGDPDGLAGTDAATLGHVGGWLVQLADIAVALAERMNRSAAYRRANPEIPATVDLDRGWALVTRAMRWVGALQGRFMAEIKAVAKIVLAAEVTVAKAAGEVRENRRDGPEQAPVNKKPSVRATTGRMPPEHCIDGKSVAEVVAQICADLSLAATLLHGRSTAQQIAAIAEAARALLGGPDQEWRALPVPDARPRAAGEAVAAAAEPVTMQQTGSLAGLEPDTG